MKTAITISISMAMALSVTVMIPASAQVAPVVVPSSGHSPSAGPWVVGAIGLGALSVIARAKVVADSEKRELTSTEAAQAIFLPFFWVSQGRESFAFPFGDYFESALGPSGQGHVTTPRVKSTPKPCGPPLRCPPRN